MCDVITGVGGVTVSIVAFQTLDPGSIPGRRRKYFLKNFLIKYEHFYYLVLFQINPLTTTFLQLIRVPLLIDAGLNWNIVSVWAIWLKLRVHKTLETNIQIYETLYRL